jgi:hypothetical protein
MNTTNIIDQAKKQLTDILFIDKDRIEELRTLLEREQHRKVTLTEAREVGIGLISLYECLAGGVRIVRSNLKTNKDKE